MSLEVSVPLAILHKCTDTTAARAMTPRDVCRVFSDVPSNPYSVRLSAVSQRLATVTFMKPDSHGGVPISYYLVQYKEVGLQDWRDVRSHSIQSECSSHHVGKAAAASHRRLCTV